MLTNGQMDKLRFIAEFLVEALEDYNESDAEDYYEELLNVWASFENDKK